MRHAKGICCVSTRLHLVALMTILLMLTLSGCSQTTRQDKISVSNDAISAPLPNALMALTLDETSLIVEVIVDNAAPRTCTNLSIDQTNNIFSCDITLPAGTYALILNYSVIDTTYGTVRVATTPDIEVNVIAGQTTPADFSTTTLIYDDNDNDGISNLDELDEGSNPATPSYYVGGTISGLSGSGAVIQLNGGNDLTLTSDGNFKLIPAVAGNSSWIVTILTQPGSPNQTCTVDNDRGTINSATVTDVTVTCVTVSYTIGGTVTGLVGGELVLQNNGDDNLVINTDGNFTFATALSDGSAYAVTVLVPPAEPGVQRCTIENSEGVLEGGNVNVTVNCQLLLFISADDGLVGRELFATDGTTAGTSLVRDINISASADPDNLVVANGIAYFVATSGMTGRELWKTNGTAAGTVLVRDIRSGSSDASPDNLTAVGDTLYFSARDDTNGEELWKSDGTGAGTMMVKDINPGLSGASPRSLTTVGSTLYFSADDGTNDRELWKSDGTTAGTVRVKSIAPFALIAVGNTLYFNVGEAASFSSQLWKSDGTTTGTMLMANTGRNFYFPDNLAAVGNTLYFSTSDDTNGAELWKSDGTDAGTAMIKDIRPGSPGAAPDNLTPVGNILYFSADDGTNGRELWKSDGTDAGTVLVKDIRSGSSGVTPDNLTPVGNILYFSADDGTNGRELWKSDGTADGTVLVKDIQPGPTSAAPDNLTAVDSTLYFSADDDVNGRELWKSDGTDTGTRMVTDMNPNFGAGSNPVPLNVN